MLNLDITTALRELKALKAKNVFLQIPEGLKINAEDLVEQLEKEGFNVATSMDPCFGACDLKQKEAQALGCDAVLHLGHTKFVEKTTMPVVYAPLSYELGKKLDKIMEKLNEYLKKNSITEVGLTTTAQFLHYLPPMQKKLAEKRITAIIGKGKRTEDGQVLGCNYSSAQVKPKTIIYLGDGLFHPLGIHYSTGKEVIITNPLEEKITTLGKEKDEFLKRRILIIEKARDAKEYAILVSTKEGQNRRSEALEIKKAIENEGKKAKIYTMDFISEDALLGIKAEAYINTACPRIGIDDYARYKKPMLNKDEVDYLLGKKSYEEYKLKEIY